MVGIMDGTNRKSPLLFLLAALLVGAALRLCFPGDIEYKSDEKYMFETAQFIGASGAWPALGMASGVKVKNPGMSVWVFGALEILTGAKTPPELARGVQLLNILALALLAFFSLRLAPETERKPWFWATALAAVNPFAVLFQRKIWAQCTLPFFCVLFWIAWHYRKKRAGAFFWGLIGVCLGQIHMSGFFLAAGVFLWTLYRDRQARWGFWIAGSLLGAVPLLPWLQYMAAHPGTGAGQMNPVWILYPKYWIYWATDPLGIGLTYSLKTRHFLDFLGYPLVAGHGTYLVAVLHVIILGAGLWLVHSWRKAGGTFRWKADTSETGLTLQSALWAVGVLMTLSCVELFRHYLIVTFPLEFVWLARLAFRGGERGERCLKVLWAAQLLLSVMFLVYIHLNHGDPLGDYGVAYQFQGQ